ncbi:MAG: hypothetical protein QM811_16840 [Pirellulales bacterium]
MAQAPTNLDPACAVACQLGKLIAEKREMRQTSQRTLKKARRVIVALSALVDPAKLTPDVRKMVEQELMAIDNEFRARGVQMKADEKNKK